MFKLAVIACLLVASNALPTTQEEVDVRSISASASGSFNVSLNKPSPSENLQIILQNLKNATASLPTPTVVVQTVSLDSLVQAYQNKTAATAQAISSVINSIPTPSLPSISLPSITLPAPPNITGIVSNLVDKTNATVQAIVNSIPSPPSISQIVASTAAKKNATIVALTNLIPTPRPFSASASVFVPKPNVGGIPSAIANITSASLSALANVSSAIGANINSVLTPTTGYNLSVSVNKGRTGTGASTSRVAGSQLMVESREDAKTEEVAQFAAPAPVEVQAAAENAEDPERLLKPLLLVGGAAALSSILSAYNITLPGVAVGATINARSELPAQLAQPAQPFYYQPYPYYYNAPLAQQDAPQPASSVKAEEVPAAYTIEAPFGQQPAEADGERGLLKPLILVASGITAAQILANANTTSVNAFLSSLPSISAGATINARTGLYQPYHPYPYYQPYAAPLPYAPYQYRPFAAPVAPAFYRYA